MEGIEFIINLGVDAIGASLTTGSIGEIFGGAFGSLTELLPFD